MSDDGDRVAEVLSGAGHWDRFYSHWHEGPYSTCASCHPEVAPVMDLTHEEAYALVAGEMYVPGEDGYQTPDDVIAGLEPEVVSQAKKYAEYQNLPWPPIASGMIMTIYSETP